jgi:hypothetical protein
MIELILTIDYELFLGEKTGTVNDCMIEPTEKLASIIEKNGSRMTVFWDILHYYRLLELENGYPELMQDRLLIEKQILDLTRRGHDIQLHIHPHWLDAKYENGNWIFEYKRFKLHNLLKENNPNDINTIVGCVTYSKRLLEKLIREVNPGYKVMAFRAGGYLIEPFGKIMEALLINEIKIDSSVCPNSFNDDGIFSFDFRSYQNKAKYSFKSSPKDIEETGSFVEIPITTVKIPALINLFFKILRKIKYPDLESERKGSGTGEYSKVKGINNYNKFFSLTHSKFSQLTTDSNFKERLDYIINKVPDHSTMILHPKLLNSHTLWILENYISTNKFRFISIQHFVTVLKKQE